MCVCVQDKLMGHMMNPMKIVEKIIEVRVIGRDNNLQLY